MLGETGRLLAPNAAPSFIEQSVTMQSATIADKVSTVNPEKKNKRNILERV